MEPNFGYLTLGMQPYMEDMSILHGVLSIHLVFYRFGLRGISHLPKLQRSVFG